MNSAILSGTKSFENGGLSQPVCVCVRVGGGGGGPPQKGFFFGYKKKKKIKRKKKF